MDFRFLDGVKTAAELKKEKEDMKNIKADMISASDTEEKKAIYKYFDGEAIIDSLSMSADTAKKAKELIKNNQVRLTEVNDGIISYGNAYGYYTQDPNVCGIAVAKVESSENCKVDIEFSKDRLKRAYCNCSKCFDKNRIGGYLNDTRNCEHVVATVFLLNAYLDSHELGDETNYFGEAFLSHFDEETDLNEEPVHIVPKLIMSYKSEYDTSLYIQFKIGRKKLVQIKSYRNFVDALRDNEIYPLGKNDSVKLGYGAFDDKSIKYVKFIEGLVDTEASISYKLLDYVKTGLNVSKIPVDGANIDDIYNLLVGEKVELTTEYFSKKTVTDIELRDFNEKITIGINPI